MQWNMNGFSSNYGDLELLVHKHQPTIIALQEVHNVSQERLDRSLGGNYTWILKPFRNNFHSIAVGVRRPAICTEIQTDTELPVLAIRIPGVNELSIACFYLPTGRKLNLKLELLNTLKSIPGPLLLLGDSNAHHHAWGSHKCDKRGKELLEITRKINLEVLNSGVHTYTKGSYSSAVDISFASPSLLPKLTWRTSDCTMGSDHYPIIIESNSRPAGITRRPKWKLDEADWDLYKLALSNKFSRTESTQPSVESLSEAITEAASLAIPRTSSTVGRRALCWWTETTKAAVKARRKALRATKRLPNGHPDKEASIEHLRKMRIECRQTIRESKNTAWERFIDGISSAELWRRVNAISGKRRLKGIALSLNSTTTDDPTEVAEVFAEYFHSLSSFNQYSAEFKLKNNVSERAVADFKIPDSDPHLYLSQPFTAEELNYALHKGKGKSAGQDDINYQMIHRLPPTAMYELLRTYNHIWEERSFPETWRKSIIVPIKKPSGPDDIVSSYRPISLTCCLSKVMERMVNRRLVQHLTEEGLLDPRQHAFRPGQGSNTYLGSLNEALAELKTGNTHAEMLTLDISKAYNSTWTPGVLAKTSPMGNCWKPPSFHQGVSHKPLLPGHHRQPLLLRTARGNRGSPRICPCRNNLSS